MATTEETYHHGDLRPALIDAVLEIARDGGVEHLSLRAVTRLVGVAPNAAYRHFDDFRALTVAAALVAQDRLAAAMREQTSALLAQVDSAQPAADAAIARLRGVGLGYIHFAIAEPGWFALALLTFDPNSSGEPSVTVDAQVPPPFQLLLDALDGMVEAGALSPTEREHAEWPCWSAVHGFADIATRGPLQRQPAEVLSALGAHVVDRIIAGLHQHQHR
ncbi:TetR/AcrR family transcriptional regulator [Demequina aestuarii]|uniref:TetR/AcrR family transcriptional regulator n=1 Tax=Demequina aestuarii TaxID=327095 RepID=UPI000783B5B6|nr:TetR-like C-terminal domain-containing protein [Demequina aestuarii]